MLYCIYFYTISILNSLKQYKNVFYSILFCIALYKLSNVLIYGFPFLDAATKIPNNMDKKADASTLY
jgi:hypothetical protein